ncbi:MAG: hypothetical protein KGZ56_00925 [Dethiobacter sp.]|nr:hypothetical protein [Dethiobacter sp.]MBS3898695.1 hypothetical protein [Dethiobacter sp.]
MSDEPVVRLRQQVVIDRPKHWTGAPDVLKGSVIYINRHYFTVRTATGYCESILLSDIKIGAAKILSVTEQKRCKAG